MTSLVELFRTKSHAANQQRKLRVLLKDFPETPAGGKKTRIRQIVHKVVVHVNVNRVLSQIQKNTTTHERNLNPAVASEHYLQKSQVMTTYAGQLGFSSPGATREADATSDDLNIDNTRVNGASNRKVPGKLFGVSDSMRLPAISVLNMGPSPWAEISTRVPESVGKMVYDTTCDANFDAAELKAAGIADLRND